MADQQDESAKPLANAAPGSRNNAMGTEEQLRAMLLGDAAADHHEVVEKLAESLMGPTARVVLPPEEDMVLRLVSEQTIRRLDESRSTSRFLWTVVATAVGGILGFVTNVVTSGQDVDALAWAFLALLAVVATAAGTYGGVVAKRERTVMKSLLRGRE